MGLVAESFNTESRHYGAVRIRCKSFKSGLEAPKKHKRQGPFSAPFVLVVGKESFQMESNGMN